MLPDYEKPFSRDAFPEQILLTCFCGTKVIIGQMPGDNPVSFLRPGGIQIAGSQARLNMTDSDMIVERPGHAAP